MFVDRSTWRRRDVVMVVVGLMLFALATATFYFDHISPTQVVFADGEQTVETRTIVEAYQLLSNRHYTKLQDGELAAGAIQGMLQTLGDRWAAYSTPQENLDAVVSKSTEADYYVFGFVTESIGGYPVVTRVRPGSTAAEQGLQEGDQLSRIAGVSMEGMDSQGLRRLLSLRTGETATVSVFRHGATRTFSWDIPLIPNTSLLTHRLLDNRWGYIRLGHFDQHSGDAVAQIVQSMRDRGVEGIILDLRDNPGGSFTAALKIAGLFVGKGPIVSVVSPNGPPEVYESHNTDPFTNVVVLVNQRSASAAELVAGAISDRGAGTVVGSRTFGKGTVQSILGLGNGGEIKFTTGHFLTPSGHWPGDGGITPDVLLTPGQNPIQVATGLLEKVIVAEAR